MHCPLSKAVSGDGIYHKTFPMTLHPLKGYHYWMHAKLLVKLVCNRLSIHRKHVNYVSQPGSGWAFVQKGYLFWFLISEHNRLENNLREDGVSEYLDLNFTAVQLLLLCTEQKILSVDKMGFRAVHYDWEYVYLIITLVDGNIECLWETDAVL